MRFLVFALLAGLGLAQVKRPGDEFKTSAGVVRLTVINHASFMLEGGGAVIHVDPVGASRYEGLPQADLILITHTHGDHLDPQALARLRKPATVVIGPEAAKSVAGLTIMRNGDSRDFGKWRIEAVPAYNLSKGTPGERIFHPKGEGNGYVLTLADLRLYVAGDTGPIPEMANLKGITAAFLPMNQPFTMTPEEVASAARSFKPKILYPYHSRGSDTAALKKALEGSGIEVRLLDWYY